MKITVFAISDKMPRWVLDVSQDYLKRFAHPIQCDMVEIPAPKRGSTLSIQKAKALEAEVLLSKIPENAHCILLDEKGKMHTSQELSKRFLEWQHLGKPIALVIGGPDGFDPKMYARANELWSLSGLTFPHPIVRIIAIEQLYRAWSITKGHPYHRN
jgi:23S rRNA (pseudouridine1915-N3)-methyltransferase